MKFPEKLQALIDRRGTSLASLATRTGIVRSSLSRMTAGAQRPYLDQAAAIARELCVPLAYLADDGADALPEPDYTAAELAVVHLMRALGVSPGEVLAAVARMAPPQ